jgi:hypothetical protein
MKFSKEKVDKLFDVLTKITDQNNIDASRIYNMDETGLSTVQKPQKILPRKGKHQVGAITSGERGTITTCVCCMSASGNYVPPMLIFKRMRMKNELKRGAAPGTQFTCSENGWITSEIFVKWLEHLIFSAKPTADKKVLLILDGHATHTKNLDANNLAMQNDIIMLSLPAYTTHH